MAKQGWPITQGNFGLTIDRLEVGFFQEVSGLSVTIDVDTVVEGGQNQFAHKLPGQMTWPNIVLKRGMTDGQALFQWMQRTSGQGFASAGNKISRLTGAISLYSTFSRSDGTGKPARVLRTWEFTGAFPVRWSGPRLAVEANDIATEELEFAHHGFQAKR